MTQSKSQGSVVDQTQDSQAYLEAVKADLIRLSQSEDRIIADRAEDGSLKEETRSRLTAGDKKQRSSLERDLSHPLPLKQQAEQTAPNKSSRLHESRVDDVAPPRENRPVSQQHHAKPPIIDRAKPQALPGPRRKMDISQQTPTQINEDRDYAEVYDSMPPSPVEADTQHTSNEERTLMADDTGAVNFDLPSQFARPSSQVSEDAGFEETRGDWRIPDKSYKETPFKPRTAAPETPVLPQNPFAGGNFGAAAPLAASQLFGQTQFSSAVKRVISPTSSRPSPHLMPNSISIHLAETSPLKDRANVSSPTEVRSSSPPRLHEVPETVCRPSKAKLTMIEEETPSNSRSTNEEMTIPESPTIRPLKSSGQPLDHYETMKKSQERKSTGGVEIRVDETDSDSDNPIKRLERRRRAEKKRAQAAQEMEKIRYVPVVRSSSDEKPSKRRRIASEERVVESSKSEPPAVILDSQQKGPAEQPPVDISTQGTTEELVEPELEIIAADEDLERVIDTELIPATSPARSSLPATAPPRLTGETPEPQLPIISLGSGNINSGESSSLPRSGHRIRKTYARKTRRTKTIMVISSSASEAPPNDLLDVGLRGTSPSTSPTSPIVEDVDVEERPEVSQIRDVDKGIQAALSKNPRRSATRSGRVRDANSNPLTPVPRSAVLRRETSSSLSSLSSAPSSSAMTTPATKNSLEPERHASVPLRSPVGGRNLRKRALHSGASSVSPQPMRTRKVVKRPPHLSSQSTDELHHSPNVSVMERSVINPRAAGSLKPVGTAINRRHGLFHNMAFAISFQSEDLDREELESKIEEAGGFILSQGFDELFTSPAIMGTAELALDEEEGPVLNETCLDIGFTALIADGHSRKAKYMQALALGLPCLAHQWITACLRKDELVEWEPYLLCAGSSAILGHALRSRQLTPYSSAEAKLVDIVNERRQLLKGHKIMIVVKKTRNEVKQPYIFLVQALGPSISRAFTTQQAKEVMLESAHTGKPYDWVYVDQGTGTIDSILSGPEPKGRKRQRPPWWMSASLSNIRALNDELVIQSLILGRVVEESEVNTFGNKSGGGGGG